MVSLIGGVIVAVPMELRATQAALRAAERADVRERSERVLLVAVAADSDADVDLDLRDAGLRPADEVAIGALAEQVARTVEVRIRLNFGDHGRMLFPDGGGGSWATF